MNCRDFRLEIRIICRAAKSELGFLLAKGHGDELPVGKFELSSNP